MSVHSIRTVLIRAVLPLTALLLSSAAGADALYCDGKVRAIGVYNGGEVFVQIDSTPQLIICGLNGVNATTCKAQYALLLALNARQGTVRMYFDTTAANNTPTCAALGSNGNPTSYLMHSLD